MDDFYTASLKGQFLVAMPLMVDPNFFKTVICICEHNSDGAMGMVINRPYSSIFGKNIFDALEIESDEAVQTIPIYKGGPVHTNDIFVIHGPPNIWQSSLIVTDSIILSNTLDILEAISQRKGPESFIIVMGFAGWGPGQLEAEIKENVWLNCPIDTDIIFNSPIDIRWETAVGQLGIDPASISNIAGHA